MKKRFPIFFSLLLALAFLGGARHVMGDDSQGWKQYDLSRKQESKIYGTVEKIPSELIGTWIVDGREVLVTRETFIEKEHGRTPAVGSYVKVEGTSDGKAFVAGKIEEKSRKR